MDSAVIERRTPTPSRAGSQARRRPGRAEAAVRTLIEWAGDDPDREGLTGTPGRVVRAYEEFFAGYDEDPVALLATTFLNHALFDQPQVLRWTTKFQDNLDPRRGQNILLDHILFTQALTRSGTSPLEARANAGWVEHLVSRILSSYQTSLPTPSSFALRQNLLTDARISSADLTHL